KPLYEVQYPAPGAPEEAKRLALEHHLLSDHQWGLDHGAWSVLRHLYPQANVPVFQLSLDHQRTFAEHIALGRELQELRERGVLILGSGNLVHNLHRINWEMADSAYPWAQEFDAKVRKRSPRGIWNRWESRTAGAPRCWLRRIQHSSIMLPFCTVWGAQTSRTSLPIPMKELSLERSRCVWCCSSHNFLLSHNFFSTMRIPIGQFPNLMRRNCRRRSGQYCPSTGAAPLQPARALP